MKYDLVLYVLCDSQDGKVEFIDKYQLSYVANSDLEAKIRVNLLLVDENKRLLEEDKIVGKYELKRGEDLLTRCTLRPLEEIFPEEV